MDIMIEVVKCLCLVKTMITVVWHKMGTLELSILMCTNQCWSTSMTIGAVGNNRTRDLAGGEVGENYFTPRVVQFRCAICLKVAVAIIRSIVK